MSEKMATYALDDGEIRLAASNSLGDYYKLGRKITVRVSGSHHLCLTCVKNECHHINRLDDWMRDHPNNEQGAAA